MKTTTPLSAPPVQPDRLIPAAESLTAAWRGRWATAASYVLTIGLLATAAWSLARLSGPMVPLRYGCLAAAAGLVVFGIFQALQALAGRRLELLALLSVAAAMPLACLASYYADRPLRIVKPAPPAASQVAEQLPAAAPAPAAKVTGRLVTIEEHLADGSIVERTGRLDASGNRHGQWIATRDTPGGLAKPRPSYYWHGRGMLPLEFLEKALQEGELVLQLDTTWHDQSIATWLKEHPEGLPEPARPKGGPSTGEKGRFSTGENALEEFKRRQLQAESYVETPPPAAAKPISQAVPTFNFYDLEYWSQQLQQPPADK